MWFPLCVFLLFSVVSCVAGWWASAIVFFCLCVCFAFGAVATVYVIAVFVCCADVARLHRLLPPLVSGDVTLGKAEGSKPFQVCAGKDFAVDALRMAPLVPSPAWPRVLVRSTSPLAVPVEVHSGLLLVGHFVLLGAAAMPKASALAEADGVIRQHDWKPGQFPWPFWYVRRVNREEDANFSLVRVVSRTVVTCAFDGRNMDPFCDNFDVHIPVLTNTRVLARGDELTVWSRPQPRPSAPKAQSTTWEKQARADLRRQTPRSAGK